MSRCRRGQTRPTAATACQQAVDLLIDQPDQRELLLILDHLEVVQDLRGLAAAALLMLATALRMRTESGERVLLSNTHYEIGLVPVVD